MAVNALSTLGVIFGWGVETEKGKCPSTFKEIEECISVGGVDLSPDKLDATPLNATRKQYIKGYEDTGGELPVTFNYSDTFIAQWQEMLDAYNTAKESNLDIWFEAYHPSLSYGFFYIVEPVTIPAPELATGNVLQVTINNILKDYPEEMYAAIKPDAPLALSAVQPQSAKATTSTSASK